MTHGCPRPHRRWHGASGVLARGKRASPVCAPTSRARRAVRSIGGEKPKAKGVTRPFKPYRRRVQDESNPVSSLQSLFYRPYPHKRCRLLHAAAPTRRARARWITAFSAATIGVEHLTAVVSGCLPCRARGVDRTDRCAPQALPQLRPHGTAWWPSETLDRGTSPLRAPWRAHLGGITTRSRRYVFLFHAELKVSPLRLLSIP